MNLFDNNWTENSKFLIEKYKDRKHPLEYKNLYQLIVMVILSAQDSEVNINKIAPKLFEVFPNMETLSVSNTDTLAPYVSKVKNFQTKVNWLIETAQSIRTNQNIPLTMQTLTSLKGIGRKSANVIMREAKQPAEGIIVDLHVIRVAPRIGLANGTDATKIEKQLMQIFDKQTWKHIGMALSFLGRETCRPTNPRHNEYPIKEHCIFYNKNPI